jgi:hypothetical protein
MTIRWPLSWSSSWLTRARTHVHRSLARCHCSLVYFVRSARDTRDTTHQATRITHNHARAGRTDVAPAVVTCTQSLRRVVNFLLQPTIFRLHRAVHYRPHPYNDADADAEHIVVISMNQRIYACNSMIAGASLVMLHRRLGNVPRLFSHFSSHSSARHTINPAAIIARAVLLSRA